MADLTDRELAALRPNMRLDRASESILRRHLIALLDEVQRHRSDKAKRLASEATARGIADMIDRGGSSTRHMQTRHVEMPERKWWDAELFDRGSLEAESSDYIDGWNDALDAVAEKI